MTAINILNKFQQHNVESSMLWMRKGLMVPFFPNIRLIPLAAP